VAEVATVAGTLRSAGCRRDRSERLRSAFEDDADKGRELGLLEDMVVH